MIFFFVSKNLEKNCKFFKLMFHILGGQNFKLDSYKDVVRPAANIVSCIEFSFSRNLHFENEKNDGFIFCCYYCQHYQPETEDVRNQHKRSVRSRRTDGGAGGDSGFLSVKTIPPKMVCKKMAFDFYFHMKYNIVFHLSGSCTGPSP